MKFTDEQRMWLEDTICNKILVPMMRLRTKYGIDPCQKCIKSVEKVLEEIRNDEK